MGLTGRGFWNEPGDVESAAANVRERSRVVAGPDDLDDLFDRVRDDEVVLLGEASHGTSEFYRWRVHLTARLIEEAGFDFVAVEGDWPACREIDHFVRGERHGTVREAIDAFERWPTWMWANWEAVELFEWLEVYNREIADESAGFYGLDVYSLFESLDAVLEFLSEEYPDAVEEAREAVQCFEPYGDDAREYARSVRMVPKTCQEEVVELLRDLRERRTADGPSEFDAEQNALVAKNAEAYYRALASGDQDSWNVRDRHMSETLDRLLDYHGPDASAVVWAHNTHVGDARATDMESKGRINIGQLVRENHSREDISIVGFGTHAGDVIAADEWGADPEEKELPAAQSGSYGDVFSRAGGEDRLLFADDVRDGDALAEPRGHRAVGVVYHPSRESGNYVPTDLRERYDAFLHVEETESLHSLAVHPERERVPDLYPSGL